MYRFTKTVIISLCIALFSICIIFMIPTLLATSGNLSASDNTISEIKSPILTTNLKLKSFRGDTALAIELFVNKWLKDNPGLHIYFTQSHSTTLGSRILYIWYK